MDSVFTNACRGQSKQRALMCYRRAAPRRRARAAAANKAHAPSPSAGSADLRTGLQENVAVSIMCLRCAACPLTRHDGSVDDARQGQLALPHPACYGSKALTRTRTRLQWSSHKLQSFTSARNTRGVRAAGSTIPGPERGASSCPALECARFQALSWPDVGASRMCDCAFG